MLSGAAGAERVDVVPRRAHCHGELHRLDRSILSDRFQKILEFIRPFERQFGRITWPVEQGSRKRPTGFDGARPVPAHAEVTMDSRRLRVGQICFLRYRLSDYAPSIAAV